jgi:hypothetical protein
MNTQFSNDTSFYFLSNSNNDVVFWCSNNYGNDFLKKNSAIKKVIEIFSIINLTAAPCQANGVDESSLVPEYRLGNACRYFRIKIPVGSSYSSLQQIIRQSLLDNGADERDLKTGEIITISNNKKVIVSRKTTNKNNIVNGPSTDDCKKLLVDVFSKNSKLITNLFDSTINSTALIKDIQNTHLWKRENKCKPKTDNSYVYEDMRVMITDALGNILKYDMMKIDDIRYERHFVLNPEKYEDAIRFLVLEDVNGKIFVSDYIGD